MKTVFIVLLFFIPLSIFGQTKSDIPDNEKCEISINFEEPERDKKTKKIAKKMNRINPGSFPTLEDIKSHVSIENDVDKENVQLLRMSEQMGNGIYIYCINGTKKKYKRTGTVIFESGTNPLDN